MNRNKEYLSIEHGKAWTSVRPWEAPLGSSGGNEHFAASKVLCIPKWGNLLPAVLGLKVLPGIYKKDFI